MKKKILIFFALFAFGLYDFSLEAFNRTVIFTYSFNRPDFIEIQHKTFKKFVRDEYEFIVFNDATNPSIYKKIHETCRSLGVHCIDMPQFKHLKGSDASWRNAEIVNFSLDVLGFDCEDIVVLIDSDLFLVREFSFIDYMKNYSLAAHPQTRCLGSKCVDYMWIGLVFIDMNRLPNKRILDFSPGIVNGVQTDTGGFTHFYLSKNRDVPFQVIRSFPTQDAYKILKDCCCSRCLPNSSNTRQIECKLNACSKFDDHQVSFIRSLGEDPSEFYLDGCFYHYRCGSNWNGASNDYHMRKTRLFNEYISVILEQ